MHYLISIWVATSRSSYVPFDRALPPGSYLCQIIGTEVVSGDTYVPANGDVVTTVAFGETRLGLIFENKKEPCVINDNGTGMRSFLKLSSCLIKEITFEGKSGWVNIEGLDYASHVSKQVFAEFKSKVKPRAGVQKPNDDKTYVPFPELYGPVGIKHLVSGIAYIVSFEHWVNEAYIIALAKDKKLYRANGSELVESASHGELKYNSFSTMPGHSHGSIRVLEEKFKKLWPRKKLCRV